MSDVTFEEWIEDVKLLASYHMGEVYVSLDKLKEQHPEIMDKYKDDEKIVIDSLVQSVNNRISVI